MLLRTELGKLPTLYVAQSSENHQLCILLRTRKITSSACCSELGKLPALHVAAKRLEGIVERIKLCEVRLCLAEVNRCNRGFVGFQSNLSLFSSEVLRVLKDRTNSFQGYLGLFNIVQGCTGLFRLVHGF